MILTDTGPLLGLLCKNDQYHELCVEAFASQPKQQMLTTWSCFTEAMYLLEANEGFKGQQAL